MLIKCVFLFLITASLFAQSQEGDQGLIANTLFWRQALGGEVLSLPSVQVQSAVVALDGGNIRAYSTAGNHMWNYSARGRISPFVSRSREGTSYLSRINGTLIAVNRVGRELWRRDIDAPLCAKVVPGWDGRLFVPTDRKLFCFTASGTLLWTVTFDHSFSIAPKLDRNGGVLFSLVNNEVYRVGPFGNADMWTLSAPPAALLSIDQQRIMAVHTDGTLEIIGIAQDWFLAAEEEGHTVILPRLPGRPIAAINRGDHVVSVFNDGTAALLSINERRVVWTGDSHIREIIKTGGRPDIEAEMLFDERGIFILSKDGATGFAHDGRRLWYTLLQNTAAIPALGDDGVLYSGGKDWILYAYKIEDGSGNSSDRLTRNNLYGPAPESSYGMGVPNASLMPNIPVFEDEIQGMLTGMEASINAGTMSVNEPAWTSFLLNIAASGQQHIQHRITAMRLLGKIGSWETIPWLVNIFNRNNEPLIRVAAAAAIGNIGVDPQGTAVQAFLHTLIPNTIRDEQLLLAIAQATGEMCRFSGPPLSETGIRILNLLNAASQPPGVRRQAQRELASLR